MMSKQFEQTGICTGRTRWTRSLPGVKQCCFTDFLSASWFVVAEGLAQGQSVDRL